MSLPQQRVGKLIRSTHRYGFRSGQWGRIAGIEMINGRSCYVIQWNEGHFSDDSATTDFWLTDEKLAGEQYEFAQVIP